MSGDHPMLPSMPHVDPRSPSAQSQPLDRIYGLLKLVVATTALILVIWLLHEVLVVVFAAALLAVILHGIADLLQRLTKLPYWAALVIVVLTLISLIIGLGFVAGPGLSDEVVKLRQALTEQTRGLHDRLAQTQWGKLILEQVPAQAGGDRTGSVPGVPTGLAGSVAGALGSAFGLFGALAVVLIAGIYLAAAPSSYANGILRLVAVRYRSRARDLLVVAGTTLWAWSAGQALDMLVVGIVSFLGLWFIGVPLALVLGVLAGLMNFVPYIGAIIGAIPAVIIAFSVGSSQGLEVLALYAVLQAFEGYVMAPMIQNRAVHLPPGLTILSQTFFGVALGIPGLIFATPITAALLAVMQKATPPLAEHDKVGAA